MENRAIVIVIGGIQHKNARDAEKDKESKSEELHVADDVR
jgi:hypothetical protein